MTPLLPKPAGREIIYPESDGEPIAENTLQYRWIVTIHGNVDALFKDDRNVFVAADLLWYPVEGDNTTSVAPDIMAAFGRPKGERRSYQQWNEGGIAPQVVFEVLSSGNRAGAMGAKFQFYQRHGVEEYYIYDPDGSELEGFVRRDGALVKVPEMNGWVSPRLGIRFDMNGDELVIYGPDGRRFLTFQELADERDRQASLVIEERLARLQAQQRADEERLARLQAQQRADQAQQRADQQARLVDDERQARLQAEQKNARLVEALRKLGVEPD